MNSKLFKGSLAGVAALALAAGGTTFAAWSDWDTVTGNATEAGHLKLDLSTPSGSINNVGAQAIAPGEFRTIDFMVSSADLDGVPLADLYLSLTNLADQENGCGTTSSEQAVDDCASNPVGEFSSQGYIRVRYSNPAPIGSITYVPSNQCNAPGGLVNSVGYAPPSNNDTTVFPRLGGFAAGGQHSLGQLEDGEAVCVRFDIGLDPTATNKVQSDSSTFDVRFDLEQVI
jgi:predicted ribosomally synthesized peptide with SipW-like signal peptide